MAIVFSACLLLCAFLLLFFGRRKEDYVPIYKQVTPQESSQVVSLLKEKKIPFHLENQGTTILIPSKRVYEARLDLATKGLPQGNAVGFEIFDKSNFGQSDFAERVNFLRALQEELTRTIQVMNEVEQARVHLAIPETQVFADQEKAPTASVELKLTEGARLRDEQVHGIVQLVAMSVQGLKQANITVIDSEGNVLWDAVEEDRRTADGKLTLRQFQIQRELQKEIENRVKSMLERVIGPEKVVVRASVTIDLTSQEIDDETFKQPSGKDIVRTKHTIEEDYSGKDGSFLEGRFRSTVGTNPQYHKREEISDNEISKKYTHAFVPPGRVTRILLGILVDERALSHLEPGRLRKVASLAAGLDPSRGDEIAIDSVPFSRLAEMKEKPLSKDEPKSSNMWSTCFLGIFLAVLGLCVSVLILPLFFRKRGEVSPEVSDVHASEAERAGQEVKKVADVLKEWSKE